MGAIPQFDDDSDVSMGSDLASQMKNHMYTA
jgi:hypothetical protein